MKTILAYIKILIECSNYNLATTTRVKQSCSRSPALFKIHRRNHKHPTNYTVIVETEEDIQKGAKSFNKI